MLVDTAVEVTVELKGLDRFWAKPNQSTRHFHSQELEVIEYTLRSTKIVSVQ